MKKSDAKKKSKLKKTSEAQRKHQDRVRSAIVKRETKEQYMLDKMYKKVQTQDTDIKDERIKEQLRRNMEILAELEKQHDAEQEAKNKVNSDLEKQGIITIEDKLKHLSDLAVKESKLGMSGSAEASFTTT